VYTNDQPETYDMIFQWRALMDEFAKTHDNVSKVIMTEAYTSLDNMIRFYGDGKRDGSHVPFNFEMISNVNIDSTAKDYKLRIDNWLTRVPKGKHANWVVSRNQNKIFEIYH
jgi:alpha-glucosidase